MEYRAISALKSENNGENYFVRKTRIVLPSRAYLIVGEYGSMEERDIADLENYCILATENFGLRWVRCGEGYIGPDFFEVAFDFKRRRKIEVFDFYDDGNLIYLTREGARKWVREKAKEIFC